MNRYRSRTVVITGATGGIGKATFTRLYTEGASLVASGRNEKSLNRLTSNLDVVGHEVLATGYGLR